MVNVLAIKNTVQLQDKLIETEISSSAASIKVVIRIIEVRAVASNF